MMEIDKKIGIHRRLLCWSLCDHRGISLPVELLKSPLACGCQGLTQMVAVHPGHNPGRGYSQHSGRLAKVDASDTGA